MVDVGEEPLTLFAFRSFSGLLEQEFERLLSHDDVNAFEGCVGSNILPVKTDPT
jgi:hypothetical protein